MAVDTWQLFCQQLVAQNVKFHCKANISFINFVSFKLSYTGIHNVYVVTREPSRKEENVLPPVSHTSRAGVAFPKYLPECSSCLLYTSRCV